MYVFTMKVTDLKRGSKVDEIELKIISKAEPREYTSRLGDVGRVCNAVGEDETGKIKVVLWNEDIDKVNANSKIRIVNGWVSEWQKELQVSAGKFGSLEVLE